eukprot:SM000060S19692  [mRNA]  locus=s60:613880:614792:+ [translate_table: standard]
MGRRKIEIRPIADPTTRQVTFSKRRHGLFKKADQLAILCEADVAVILFSSTGRLFAFANSNTSVAEVLERYHNHSPAPAEQGRSRQDSTDQLKKQLRGAHQQLGSLMASQARLRGEDLGLLALTDLEALEEELEQSVKRVRQRRQEVMEETIVHLKQL